MYDIEITAIGNPEIAEILTSGEKLRRLRVVGGLPPEVREVLEQKGNLEQLCLGEDSIELSYEEGRAVLTEEIYDDPDFQKIYIVPYKDIGADLLRSFVDGDRTDKYIRSRILNTRGEGFNNVEHLADPETARLLIEYQLLQSQDVLELGSIETVEAAQVVRESEHIKTLYLTTEPSPEIVRELFSSNIESFVFYYLDEPSTKFIE